MHVVCSQVQVQSLVNIIFNGFGLSVFFLVLNFFSFFYNFYYISVLHVHGTFNFSKLIFDIDDNQT